MMTTQYNPYADWKHPLKRNKDVGGGLTLGVFARTLGNLLDAKVSSEVYCDYIDKEFLWGTWGNEVDPINKRNPLFVRDMRGALVAMYQAGKGVLPSEKEEEEYDDEAEEDYEVKSMSKIPESVLLETQKRIYSMKNNYTTAQEAMDIAKRDFEIKRSRARAALEELKELCAFLNEYSPDTCGCWYAEVGIDPPHTNARTRPEG